MYSDQILIQISGVSKRTFYRRLQVLRNQKLFEKGSKDQYYGEDEALRIAELLGFKGKFENHIKNGKA